MKVLSTRIIATIGLVLAFPVASMASSVYHLTDTESSYSLNWDHFSSTKSRADVLKEFQVARQDGSLRASVLQSLGFPQPTKLTKSRAEVHEEVHSMTSKEKDDAANRYGAN